MRISLIVAAARNGVIGRDGALPWHLPEDLKHFKALTLGKPILMGRKTWESLPRRPLPGRDNLVLSDALPSGARDGAHWFTALDDALDWCRTQGVPELCVIGGAALFRETLPLADTVHLTRIEAEVEGDTHLPPLGGGLVETKTGPLTHENGLSYRFIELTRAS